MTHTTAPVRFLYIDYLRAFMVLLVVFEHALLPYAAHYKFRAYIGDFGGNVFFDVFHLHNDAIMMPFLFLLAGMFVLPSLQRRGFASFAREKFFRLVIPFVLGVTILVPIQTYSKYLVTTDPNINYLDYLQNVYFFDRMAASGFWFLYVLFIFTFSLLAINTILPGFVKLVGRCITWAIERPVSGFLVFFMISAVLLGCADMLWGPYFAAGYYLKVFYILPGSFSFIFAFFFLLGAGIAEIDLNQNQAFLEKISASWAKWVGLAVVSGAIYAYYCIAYGSDGAYNYEVYRSRYLEESWSDTWSILAEYAPPVLIRTTLLGLFMCSLTVMYFSLFYRFLNVPSKVWISLAACSFGIFIFHEPIQVPVSYLLYNVDLNEYIKFAITTCVSLFGSWFLVQKILLKLPGFKRVL
jgi:glucan biosynthesis protein C